MSWEENLDHYEKLIALFPKIERKGKTTPYTSLNGHMTSFLDKEGKMGLRLSESDRDEIISTFDSTLMEQHGRIMKEFVVIPAELLTDTKKLSPYFQKSIDHVSTLKPKPTKRKKT